MRQIKSQLKFLPDLCRDRAFKLANKDVISALDVEVKTIDTAINDGFIWDDIYFWYNISQKLRDIEVRYKKDFVHIYRDGILIMGTNFSNKKDSLVWVREQIENIINN